METQREPNNSLCHKHYPSCDILHVNYKPKQKNSWIWKGILTGVNQIKKNCIWRVGNSECIDIWDDYWIPNVKPPLTKLTMEARNFVKVSQLITSQKTWDLTKLAICFNEDTINIISSIQIPTTSMADEPRWTLNNSGIFSIKFLYNSINSTGADNMDWSKIRNMKVTPVVKMFVWKAAHSILPNNMRVTAILPNINASCKLCNNGDESLTHLFLQCNFVSQVWMHLNFDMRYVVNGTNDFHDWLNDMYNNQDRNENVMEWDVFCSIVIWHIWKARCNLVFQKNKHNSAETTKTIVKYINSLMNVNSANYNTMQSLYYNPVNDDNLMITPDELDDDNKFLSLTIDIAISMMMVSPTTTSSVGLTLHNFSGTQQKHGECMRTSELKKSLK